MKNRLTIALLFLFRAAFAQEGILLDNPSFEDMPQLGRAPSGWEDCGPLGESPPDIHPNGNFGIGRPAWDGKTYLGMVVRDNDTWEAISQFLSTPLIQGRCYSLSFYACRAEGLISLSRLKNEVANYNIPAVLRIWAGNNACPVDQLLAETPPIEGIGWAKYTLEFVPEQNYDYLGLEAYYKKSFLEPYNGNVLVDGLSALTICEDGVPEVTARVDRMETPVGLPEDEETLALYLELKSLHLLRPGGRLNLEYLDDIAQAMYAFPDKRLIIEIFNPRKERKEEMLEELWSYYQEQGYDPAMIQIGSYSRHSRYFEGWLWPPKGRKIMMRLEDR